MEYIFDIFIVGIGLILGSFLNVFVLRYGTGRSMRGRSKCFTCGHTLYAKDLVPVFSYIFLGGRCRYCQSKISSQYFIVELLSAVIAILVAKRLGLSLPISEAQIFLFIFSAGFFLSLLALSVYDIKHKIIPDGMLFLSAFFALANFLAVGFFYKYDSFWLEFGTRLLEGIMIALPFFIVWLLSKGKWMGFADWKLALIIGFFFGFEMALSSVIFAFWIGAFVSIVLIFFGRFLWFERLFQFSSNLNRKSEVPFGPFLTAGALVTYLFAIMYMDIVNLFIF